MCVNNGKQVTLVNLAHVIVGCPKSPCLFLHLLKNDVNKFIKMTDSYILTMIDVLFDTKDNYKEYQENIITAKNIYEF